MGSKALHVIKGAMAFNGGSFERRDIAWTEDGAYADPKSCDALADAEIQDGKGLYVIPGLCDIHLHGACGADMSDGDPEGLFKMAKWEAAHGTTSFCPATMTITGDAILNAMSSAREFYGHAQESSWRGEDGAALARMEGIYMEGPFISREKCGAQDPRHVMAPSLEFLKKAQEASGGLVRFAVLAPEEDGAVEFAHGAFKMGIRPCVGHTACSYEQALEAFKSGACELTHTFNAMPPMLHRAPGPIPAAALAGASAELITDGIHIEDPMIAMAFRIFGEEKLILISDSMRAAGMPDGAYTLGGQEVFVKGREARLKDGTLAGSASCLLSCLKNAVLRAHVPLESAVTAAAVNPRRAAGAVFSGVGDIGGEASFIVLTPPEEGFLVRRIVVHGNDAEVAPGL
ncbi:MAG: N-acetylglucosamine-6-phosphate deacetylase [Aeromonadales bacterium]|nr:N-acetylglucosamine-6-phosphate deacetylase [Aeromonadales bacterium]MDY2890709.1 N-acetylglucosamine-6-phosphate deacetylase [Succinivibrio sp.]